MKRGISDVEITAKHGVSSAGSLSILSWLCHHAGQIAKGSAALIGLAVLGGVGYFARGAFSGARKTAAVTPKVDVKATDERGLVVRELASAVAKSEDLAGFSAETKISVLHDATSDVGSPQITDGDIDFTSQSLVGASTVRNLVVNGTIPDQLVEVGFPWAGSINITELFGEQVNLTDFSQVGNKPLPDWLQTIPEILSTCVSKGLAPYGGWGATVSGNFAYIAAGQAGLQIIDISNSTNPFLVGAGVSGFTAYGVTVSGNFAYVAAYEGLRIIDISDSVNPKLIEPGVPGSYENAVTVRNNLVYITSKGLKIIDVSNSTNPIIMGSTSDPVGYGITVKGNFAYVAAYYGGGLVIIDISNSSHPFIVSPGVPGFTGLGVTVRGNLIYVAAYDGLKIIDIGNNTNPVIIGGVSGFYGSKVTVSGNLAYIVGREGLKIVDIGNSTNAFLVGPGVSGFDATGITVRSNLAHVTTWDRGFKIIDLSRWQLYGSPVQSKCSYQIAISVENLHGNATKTFNIKTDNFPYVIGSIPNQSLNPGDSLYLAIKIANIFNDQDKEDTLSLAISPHLAWLKFGINPFFIAKKFNFYYHATGVTISGNLAYVTVTADPVQEQGLRIIDISDSVNPKLIGKLTGSGVSGFNAKGVTVRDNFAYVVAYYSGLRIIDISNSTNPFLVSHAVPKFNAFGVSVSGNLAYVAADEGLQIINISNSTNPFLVGGMPRPGGYTYGVTVRGSLAYLAASKGLEIIDISNSTNPVRIGGVSGFIANRVAVRGNLAYVASSDQGLRIIDINNSTNPVLISGVSGFNARGVTVSNNLAYVAATDGLEIIDISQPNKPIIVAEANGAAQDVAVLPANTVCMVGDSFSILDLTNYRFSGTPTDSDAGNYPITVIAADPDGAQAQTSFTIRVEGGPRLDRKIPPQIALVRQTINFFLTQGTFSDPNKDVITYEAMLTHNQTLPYFLSFNPSSATFSGIPRSEDRRNYMITILASDRIVYPPTPANFTLAVQDAIDDQTFIIGRSTAHILPIPPDTIFAGRSLVYSVKPIDSESLPGWLHFDAASRKLFGVPSIADKGTTSMQVTLNDGYGDAFFLFTLNVKPNTPPVLVSMIPVQSAKATKLYQFILQKDTFTDADGDQLRYSANLEAAASWLRFDADTRTFMGTPSGWTDAYPYSTRKYTITITATDPSNETATGIFELDLSGPSSWETFIVTGISVLGALIAAYGYTHKKHLLWDFFKKEEYRKPVELLAVGDTGFSYIIGFPAEHIKSIIVTTSRDRSCAQKVSPCCRKTLGFFSLATKGTEERVFPCGGVNAYLFPWLFYDSKINTLKSVEGGPTEEFVGKDIKIQVRGTDNRIMEEFHIRVGSQQNALETTPLMPPVGDYSL